MVAASSHLDHDRAFGLALGLLAFDHGERGPSPFRDFHQLISHGGTLLHLDFKPLICLARPG